MSNPPPLPQKNGYHKTSETTDNKSSYKRHQITPYQRMPISKPKIVIEACRQRHDLAHDMSKIVIMCGSLPNQRQSFMT
jgi:hypothetical protein